MSLAGGGQQRLPLSPQSPQTHPCAPSNYLERQPPAPTSPPTSSATSVNGSDSASPQNIVFSPPLSVAMSAQTSQTSLNSNRSSTTKDDRNQQQQPLPAQTIDSSANMTQPESHASVLSGSAKRKFEDDEEPAGVPSSKRPKKGEGASSEDFKHVDELAVVRSKAQTLGPLYKVCQQCKPLLSIVICKDRSLLVR